MAFASPAEQLLCELIPMTSMEPMTSQVGSHVTILTVSTGLLVDVLYKL